MPGSYRTTPADPPSMRGFYWSQVTFVVRSAAVNLFRYFRRLRGDKKRALKQALLSAAAGIVIYYYLLRFHLNGPWSLWWVRDIYKFNGRLFIRAIPARIFDALWPGMGLTQMVLPGAVLGLGFWLIYRLTKQPTLRL